MSRNVILIIFGAIILCIASFTNKYPLLAPDSGIYINSGFNHKVPSGKTVLYGLFIVHASWGKSLWLVIFSQALIFSLVLYYYFRYLSVSVYYHFFYLACLFFITFFMYASVTTSTISTGVFSGISILCMGLLLFATNLSNRDYLIIGIISIISMGMDASNLLSATTLIVLYGIILFWKKNRRTTPEFKPGLKRMAIAFLLVVTTWLALSAAHISFDGNFNIFSGSDLSGPVKPFEGNQQESFAVSGHIDKKTLKKFFLQHTNIDTFYDTDNRSSSFNIILRWYNEETREFLIARQFQHWLTFKYLNYTHSIAVLFCLFIFLISGIIKCKAGFRNLCGFIFLSILLQSLFKFLLIGLNSNAASQILWLMPIPLFIYLSGTAGLTPIVKNRQEPVIPGENV